MKDSYADWDAAYVLGALSSTERHDYEDHVDGCADCAAALAELGMIPALLRLIPDEDGAAHLTSEAAPAPFVVPPGRRMPVKLLAAAAAVVLIGAVATGVVVARRGPTSSEQTVALSAVAASPLRATVSLTPEAWGTDVAMTCTYAGEYGARASYTLSVVGATGQRQVVSRWRAGPGDTTRTSGATDLARSAITRLELRDAQGRLLLEQSL
ncbi:MAG TPA: zf-HC2 domain-containing protein [Pseudonocardia sp.]|jgi:hypothetical protein